MTNKKKEILEAVKQNGMKGAIIGMGGGVSKRVFEAMKQQENNMKKTGIEKL